jgi:hypothetical protein
MESKPFWDEIYMKNKPVIENKPDDLNYTGFKSQCGMCPKITGYVLDVEGCPGIPCCSLECYDKFDKGDLKDSKKSKDEILVTQIVPPITAAT